jgi:dTDP-glucose 4,6-dehydratase/UDP-glucose 4,6-dehydratase
MPSLLVTGGCGFIGSHYINYIFQDPSNIVYNIDCLNYCANVDNVMPCDRYHFIKGNICDKDLIHHILNTYHIDTVVHFAAQSHVDNSFDASLQYTQDNVVGTHVLLQTSKEYGKLKRFVHFSTDEVYGEVSQHHPGCLEQSILNPTNPYAATKAAAEMLVTSYYHSFGLPIVIIRCNNVYGPNQYPEKLIPKFIQLLRQNKPLTIHGKGQTRRNFVWVEDVARATEIVRQKGVVGEIYNIGTSQEYSVMDVATLLVQKMTDDQDVTKHIVYVEDRPFNDSRYKVNADKLKALGWVETFTCFETNLDLLISYV